ncbi:MAG: sulfatase-like hydrolase/transferase [Chitinophagaceae bacterium]
MNKTTLSMALLQKQGRRYILRNLFFVFFSALPYLLPFLSHAQQKDRPNILWIVSEDNNPFLGCYGDTYAHTPHIDALARNSILYLNAFSAAPVCAPSRYTLATGTYPPTYGTENMRSQYPVPSFVHLFPHYLKEAGYYTTNNSKKDYNTVDQPEVWDESSSKATFLNRKPGQPFFAMFTIFTTHESSIIDPDLWQKSQPSVRNGNLSSGRPLVHDPEKAPIPPYLPKIPEMKHDWALYYDRITAMDEQVGQLLHQLDSLGLAENTIVFYFADNGGVLGRSKRYLYESGLHVPLLIHFPPKYRYLAPYTAGTRTDQVVSFIDFVPTVLDLAGLKRPEYLQGKSLVAKDRTHTEDTIAFGFRNRMDERYDLSRTIRTKDFRYIRNFQPYRIYAQNVQYLWLIRSIRAWEKEYKAGKLDEIQSRYFREKPTEELYDVRNDPDNIHNLATDPAYRSVLQQLRKKNHDLLLQINDAGFIPEADVYEITRTQTIYDYARSGKYDIRKVLPVAEKASERNKAELPYLVSKARDADPVVRYWAAIGLLALGKDADVAAGTLKTLLSDEKKSVRVVAAEALYRLGNRTDGLESLYRYADDAAVMVRVQALNALQDAPSADLLPLRQVLEKIVGNKVSEYDVKAAKYLLEKMEDH